MNEPDRYEHITAIVDCGDLRWEYQVQGLDSPGRMSHDEDISEWSKKDIIDVTMMSLGVPDDQRDIIKVEYA